MNDQLSDKSAATLRPGIHPTAVIHGDVTLEEGVQIGPYCVVEGRVKIGAGTTVLAHTIIQKKTLIGAGCRLGPNAAIGTDPQHLAYDGRETYLIVEDNVVVREFATLHRSTKPGLENATRIGRGSFLMVGSHVAHDCRVGERVTMANSVHLGGHVTVGDRVFIGGATVVHQFCRVGQLAMIAGGEALSKDVMPFGAVYHDRHKGYNAVGCRRAGLDASTIRALRAAFLYIHSQGSAMQAVRDLSHAGLDESVPQVRELIEFIRTTRRGITPSAASVEPAMAE